MNKEAIGAWFQSLQDEICACLEGLDGTAKFHEDLWERNGGGGGRTRIIQGENIEKGGVNFSAVHGNLTEGMAKSLGIPSNEFYATGVSIVLHPSNPHLPIIHMNVRYFEAGEDTWWFGGGIDVTPHYIIEDDAKFFHKHIKSVCDEHDSTYYPEHKKWADDYFFIKHRNETRGIGGIFFDKLNQKSKEECFDYVKGVGKAFNEIYTHLYNSNIAKSYTEVEKEWQLIRRGRYVEFNLVWDRGTKFGLETDGRTESILMSLPKDAKWFYNHHPDPSSEEGITQSLLKKGIDWTKR